MDRIAYHPIRVTPHTSLFLPYTEQELKLYQDRSANPLVRLPAPAGNTYRPPHLRHVHEAAFPTKTGPGPLAQQRSPLPAQRSPRALPASVSNAAHDAQARSRARFGGPPLQPPPVMRPVQTLHADPASPYHPVQQRAPDNGMQPRPDADSEKRTSVPTHRSPPYYSTPSPVIINGSPNSCTSPRQKRAHEAPQEVQADLKRSRLSDSTHARSFDGQQSISEAVAEHCQSSHPTFSLLLQASCVFFCVVRMIVDSI